MSDAFEGKRIILGVTGSIAAYKAPLIVRELVKLGADVHVVLTPSAKEFVTELVLENLSRNAVVSDMFAPKAQRGGAWHIQLTHECDAMLIAPCSASTLGKIANGICDNSLVTLAIALPNTVPLLVSPAMDTSMWLHPATQRNVQILKSDGVIVLPPEEGELSSGLVGPGRMPEIDVIIDALQLALTSAPLSSNDSVNQVEPAIDDYSAQADYEKKLNDALAKPLNPISDAISNDSLNAEFELIKLKEELDEKSTKDIFKGKKILITAGPTFEKIDDVRFISNYSSGKMGHALATEAKRMGADVTLVCGPVTLITPNGVKRIDVESAEDMYNAVMGQFKDTDISILSAAVADYSPSNPQEGKIKKNQVGESMTLELKSTKDILYNLGQIKSSSQKLIGFALETTNELNYAFDKLYKKNADMIVLNSANKPRSGFRGDDNTITIVTTDGRHEAFPPMSKLHCARVILKRISNM